MDMDVDVASRVDINGYDLKRFPVSNEVGTTECTGVCKYAAFIAGRIVDGPQSGLSGLN